MGNQSGKAQYLLGGERCSPGMSQGKIGLNRVAVGPKNLDRPQLAQLPGIGVMGILGKRIFQGNGQVGRRADFRVEQESVVGRRSDREQQTTTGYANGLEALIDKHLVKLLANQIGNTIFLT